MSCFCFQASIDLYKYKEYCIDAQFDGKLIQFLGILTCDTKVINEAQKYYKRFTYYIQTTFYKYCRSLFILNRNELNAQYPYFLFCSLLCFGDVRDSHFFGLRLRTRITKFTWKMSNELFDNNACSRFKFCMDV